MIPLLSRSKEKPQKLNLNHFRTLFYMSEQFRKVQHLEGDIVECGVGKGGSLRTLAVCAYFEGKNNRTIWGFDSFKGLPDPTEEDKRENHLQAKKGDIAFPSSIVKGKLQETLPHEWVNKHVRLVEGYFEESVPTYSGSKIALLHIDADLYQSYKTVLNKLYDKVVEGGIILFDEYTGNKSDTIWPGAKKAIDEFFADKNARVECAEPYQKYYVVKPTS